MEQFRPIPEGEKQKQTPQQRGEGIRGVTPPPQGEQARPQQERGERQPLPNVWDVLERKVRLHAKDAKGRLGRDEADRQFGEVERLESELWKKGTARDRLIFNLFTSITVQPGGSLPLPFEIRELSPKEFRQFHSKVEPMSDEEIAEAIRQQDEDNLRKAREIAAKRRRPGLPGLAKY